MRKICTWWTMVLLLVGMATSVQAATVFVDGAVAASGVGTSWATAKKTLQEGIVLAVSGDEIWVKAGTYTPGTLRTDTFNLKTGVAIYGGFAGTETILGQRNGRLNLTILSGDIGTVSVNTDNSFSVVTPSGNGLLDGFTIRDGYANGGAGEGGGMYVGTFSPTVQNCVFINNACPGFTGGAVSVRGGSPIFKAVVFSGNSATYGGALYTSSGSSFENCIFQGNSATTEGGAIRTSSSGLTPTWVNCVFTGNTAPGTSGPLHVYGTGAFTNTIIWFNTPSIPMVSGAASRTLLNCNVQGGVVPAGYTNSGGFQSSDPLFANAGDPDGQDNIWGTGDDGLFPQSGSIGQNAGTATGAPSTDVRGLPRPFGGYDIGAYERGATVFVDSTASGTNTGASWTNAARDLRMALLSASAGEEVWVKAGIYKPTTTSDRTLVFVVPASVGVYGGFVGGEIVRTSPTRNWNNNQTILSGEINGASVSDNSRHVVDIGTNAVLDGFTVRDGYTDYSAFSYPHALGGGIYCNNSSPTIRNCAVINNHGGYGGGMFYYGAGANPSIENCLFVSNSSDNGGGGIFAYSSALGQISNTTITANSATSYGSGITSFSATPGPTLTNCIVSGNTGSPNVGHSGGTASWSFSLVQGSGGSAAWNGTAGVNSGNNLDANPDFRDLADLDGPDNLWMTADDGIIPRGSSPAVNSGSFIPAAPPLQDILARTRAPGSARDMGAYECRGVIFVNPAGSNTGVSWATGYITLQAALTNAGIGDEIWVKAETYTPGVLATSTFSVSVGVSVYGGFAGSETLRSQRNWRTQVTTLSGNAVARHVVTLANAATVDGFIISGGTTAVDDGGGVVCNNTSPLVQNCVITANTALNGGGLVAIGSLANPAIIGCVFAGNTATVDGGAIAVKNSARATIRNCTVSRNMGPTAAGILVQNCPALTGPTVVNTISHGNTTSGGAARPGLVLTSSPSSAAAVSFSLLEGSFTSGTWNFSAGTDGGGNIDAVPLFLAPLDPDGADNAWFTVDDGLRLRSASPAAQVATASGAPGNDILGQVRPLGGSYDMGAYEGRCPVAGFALASSTVNEGGGNASLQVNLTGIADYPISIPYSANASGVADVNIGANNLNWYFPLYTDGQENRNQVIYLQSELGGATLFHNLTMTVNQVPGQPLNRFTIRMKHTALTTYSGPTDWEGISSGWTTVYQGNVSIVSTGPITFPFVAPFSYNGSSNLMIDMSFDNITSSASGMIASFDSGTARALYGYQYGGAGDPLSWSPSNPAYSGTVTYVPMITLGTAVTRGVLTIAAGSSGGFIVVPIDDDAFDENDQHVITSLGTPTSSGFGVALLTALTAHDLTIQDNDVTPTVQFAAATSLQYESTIDRSVEVTLSGPSANSVTVDFDSPFVVGDADASDVSGLASGTITFSPGQTSFFIARTVVNDQIAEDDEIFRVRLKAPVNFSTLGATTQHAGTILNDDYAGISLSTYNVDVFEGTEGPGSANVTVSLTSQPPPGVTVRLSLASTDTSQATVLPASFDFTSVTWNNPQVFTIACVTELIRDGDHSELVTVTPTVTVGTDPKYALVGTANISVNDHDDDAAGIAVGYPVVSSTAVKVDADGVTVHLPPSTNLSQLTANSSLVFSGGKPNGGIYPIASFNDATDTVVLGAAAVPSATWRLRNGQFNSWSAIAMSADGTKQAACVNGGQIYTSTDSGVTWTVRESVRNWISISSSANGVKLIACVQFGQIYVSNDSGATWVPQITPDDGSNWTAVTCSADGTKMAACINYGQIYSNTGGTWSQTLQYNYWNDISYSDDGLRLMACTQFNGIYSSTNAGMTMTNLPSAPLLNWTSIASSTDGQSLIACSYSSRELYKSLDYGATWFSTGQLHFWNGVAISDDGSKMVASASGDQMYTSSNFGTTWTASGPFSSWSDTASSSDGSLFVACANYGQIRDFRDIAQSVTLMRPISGPVLESEIIATANSVSGLVVTLGSGTPSLALVVPGMLLTFTGSSPNAGSWRVASVAGNNVTLASRVPAGFSDPVSTGTGQGVTIGKTAHTFVKLLSEPTVSVALSFLSDDATEGTVSPASKTILPVNWNTAVLVTLTRQNDEVDDGDQFYNLQIFPATSGDGYYSGVDPADIAVETVDDDTRGAIISTPSVTVTEGGATATYTVVLTSEPASLASVVATPTIATGAADYQVTPASRTFTSTDWNVPQTFTVTAIDDPTTEPTEVFNNDLGHGFVGGDYGVVTAPPITVTVNDNDTPGYIVTPTVLTIPENGSATVKVHLATQPTGSVIINVALSGPGHTATETVNPSSLTFMPSGPTAWNLDQTITITANNDLNSANEAYLLNLIYNGASVDINYNLAIPSVSCTSIDDDNAGITITQVDAALLPDGVTNVTEGGVVDRYKVKLNTPTNASVHFIQVQISSGVDVTVSPSTLLWTTGNFAAEYIVTVTAVDDAQAEVAEPPTQITHALVACDDTDLVTGYQNSNAKLSMPSISVNVTDNDTAAILVSPASGLVVTEAATSAISFVRLASQPVPVATVSVQTVTAGNLLQMPAATNLSMVSVGMTVTFVGSTPNTGTYVILAVNGASDTITLTTTITNTAIAQSATIAPVVTMSLAASSVADGREVNVTPPTLTFNMANWNVTQAVALTGKPDSLDDGNRTWTVLTTNTTSAGEYALLPIADITGTTVDIDTVGVILSKSAISLTEGAGNDTYVVSLASLPSANPSDTVTVSINPGDQMTATPSTLVFTNTDWNNPTGADVTAHTVTITAVHDFIDEPSPHTATVTHSAIGGDYSGIAIGSVTASITDHASDVVGFTMSPSTTLILPESGSQIYLLHLNAKPQGTVTVAFTSSDSSVATVSPAVLTFTSDPGGWEIDKTFTVTAVDDLRDTADRQTTIVTVASSSDPAYNGAALSDISVTLTDNDVAGVTIAGGLSPAVVSAGLNASSVSTNVVTCSGAPDLSGIQAGMVLLFTGSSPNVGSYTVMSANNTLKTITLSANASTTSTAQAFSVYRQPLSSLSTTMLSTLTVSGVSANVVSFSGAPNLSAVQAGMVLVFTGTTPNVGSFIVISKDNTAKTVTLASNPIATSTAQPAAIYGLPASGLTASSVSLTTTVALSGAPDLSGIQAGMLLVFSGSSPNTGSYLIASANNTLKTVTLATAAVNTSTTQAVTIYSLLTNEAGGTTSFTVRLSSQPSATITIPVVVSNAQQGQLSTSSLVFDSTTWLTPQTITVTGLDLDGVDNGSAGTAFVVNLKKAIVSGGTDAAYSALADLTDSSTDIVADRIILNQRANAVPTCDQPAPVAINEDSPTTVTLTNIGSGQVGELQDVFVQATSSNPSLIPDPLVTTKVRVGTDSLTPNVVLNISLVPNASGTAVITVSITDDTSVSGTTAQLQRSFTVTVAAQNDKPQVSAAGSGVVFAEGDAPVILSPNLAIVDVDNTTLTGAIVSLDTIPNGSFETLAISAAGLTSSWNSSTGVLTIAGVQPVATYQAALRGLTYSNLSDDPLVGTRTATITVNDGTLSSLAVTTTINVSATNDAPTLAGVAALAAISEEDLANTGTEISDLISQLTITDADTGAVNGLAIIGVDNSNGVWEQTPNFPSVGWAPLAVTPSIAVLRSGAPNQRVRFLPAVDFNGPATVTVRAWDQTSASTDTTVNGGVSSFSSATATLQVTVTPVNDAPIVDLNLAGPGINMTIPSVYTEGTPAQLVMTSGVAISDVDPLPQIGGGTITLTNPVDGVAGADEMVAISPANSAIVVDMSVPHTITLTGVASLTDYEQAIKSLTYLNVSDTPSAGQRNITVTLSDGTDPSLTATGLVTINEINDIPALNVSGATTLALGTSLPLRATDGTGATASATVTSGQITGFTVTAPGSGYVVAPRVTITDASGLGATAIASISGGQVSGIAVDLSGALYTSTPIVSLAPAALVVSATDADDVSSSLTFRILLRPNLGDLTKLGIPMAANDPFTVAQLVAGDIAYQHGGLLSGADGFAIKVDDGRGGSAVAIISLTITGLVPPQVAINDSVPASWVEGDSPIQIDGSATVADTDSSNFDGGNITIVETGARLGDVVGFDSSLVGGSITRNVVDDLMLVSTGQKVGTLSGGLRNGSSGTLVIGLTSFCTPGIAQTILRGLTWTNTGDNPGVDPDALENRILTVTINDGSNTSFADQRTITVDPVDDPPVLFAYTVALTPGLAVPGQLVAVDPEGEALSFALNGAPSAGNGVVNPFLPNGSFTYRHTNLLNKNDAFGVTVTEAGVGGQSVTGNVSVLVTPDDPLAPRITSVAPVRAHAGLVFTYTPILGGFGADRDYVLIPALTESASGTVVNPATYTFSGGNSITNGATGTFQILLPVPPADTGGYYSTGILVIDRVTHQACYQPILLKIQNGFGG